MDKIVVIDDDDSIRESLQILLSESNYEVLLAENGNSGLKLIEQNHPDAVVCDLRMPGYSGLDLLEKVKKIHDYIPVILMTAFEDMETVISAMQLGAYDFIEKPLEVARFETLIKRAVESKKLSERLSIAISEDNKAYNLETAFVGKSQKMKDIVKKCGQVSMNRVTVLIQGESGTGKEIISRIIHQSGITKDKPFVAVNCTALTETLLESELFGHVKGAFTGASKETKGKFELAGEGTIFLDEISEISNELQLKLLRVIQEKEFEKVGGETTIPLKARIIAATNKDLSELAARGKFREDLYYRFKVFSIEIPPLRDRKEAIPDLVLHFLKKFNKELHKNIRKIPYEVMEMLQNYDWVGNVRELENILMQATVLTKGDVLEKENILLRNQFNHNAFPANRHDRSKMSIAEIEKEHIKLILDSVNWNKKEAYTILGITKPTLNAKIKEYQLDKEN